MVRTLLVTTALALSVPAAAQQTISPEPAAAAQPAAVAEKPANPRDDVASIVDTEFPAYDADSNGQLDQSEFARWMVALKDQEMKATGKTLPQEQVMAWASGAFTTADVDKNISVSKPELISYLSGGAG
jgi:hypothetical protein